MIHYQRLDFLPLVRLSPSKSELDNEAALHHWFLYAMPSEHPNGSVEANCSPLHVDGRQMLAGWAPGGKDMVVPFFDQPFSDKNQAFVETKADVNTGDKIVTTARSTTPPTARSATAIPSPTARWVTPSCSRTPRTPSTTPRAAYWERTTPACSR